MAANRYINTNFWRDTYIIDLDPSEKLLFLYLITNPNTNIAGIYEISVRQIAFDTGYDKDMVIKMLERFRKDGKIYYNRGWLALNNWIRHQSMNPKVQSGIARIIDELPEWLHKELLGPEDKQSSLLDLGITEPIDSLSKPIALNLIKLNLIKLNGTGAAVGSNKFDGDKKSYAKAVRADEALATKELEARTRPKAENSTQSGYELAREAVEKIKHKGVIAK